MTMNIADHYPNDDPKHENAIRPAVRERLGAFLREIAHAGDDESFGEFVYLDYFLRVGDLRILYREIDCALEAEAHEEEQRRRAQRKEKRAAKLRVVEPERSAAGGGS